MNLYVPALWIACGISLFAGMHFSATGLPRREDRAYLAFGLLSLAISAYFALTAVQYQALSMEMIGPMLKARAALVCVIFPLAVWFFSLYTGQVHWRSWVGGTAAVFAVLFVANALSNDSLLFSAIIPKPTITLPWGERVVDYTGVHAAFFWPFYIIEDLVYLWMVWRCAVLWGQGRKRRFWTLAAYLLLQLAAALHAELVTMLEWRTVTFDAFTSLALVLLMSDTLHRQQNERSEALAASLRDLGAETVRRQAVQANLRHMAYHDPLTELPNRRLLFEQVEAALGECRRRQREGAFILLGLDRFKAVNDALGHAFGDELLQAAVHRIREVHPTPDHLSRVGGDEFGLLLSALPGDPSGAARQAMDVATALAQGFMRPLRVREHELVVGVSVGIATFPDQANDVGNVLRHAGMALHLAKRSGRNRAVLFARTMQDEADRRLVLERGLRRALVENEFDLFYQPQVDARGHVSGAEAVLRWSHPELGEVEPAEFVAIAEETGLIHPLGRHVLDEACRELALWSADPARWPDRLSVNISPWQLFAQDFVETVEEAIGSAGCDPSRLVLEITESAFLHDLEDVASKMQRLNALGLRFSIDDFGSGYTSLASLKRLPIDELKIDRLFVQELRGGAGDRMVEAIIGIAHHLGLSVVAEGVETEVQRRMLFAMGCDACQGYLVSHPLSATGLVAWMQSREHASDPDASGTLSLFDQAPT